MSEIYLGVNIDHIATLRNARGTQYPDPVQAAFVAEQAGADGITVHLREDRRHITDRDVEILRQTIQTRMNLEMAVTEEMIGIACRIKPHFVCLVPEKRTEVTTEGGLDVAGQLDKVTDAVARLSAVGAQVSLFIDADPIQIDAAAESGAPLYRDPHRPLRRCHHRCRAQRRVQAHRRRCLLCRWQGLEGQCRPRSALPQRQGHRRHPRAL